MGKERGLAAHDELAVDYDIKVSYLTSSHMIDVALLLLLLKGDESCVRVNGKKIIGTLAFTSAKKLNKLYFSDTDVRGKSLILTDCSFESDELNKKLQEVCTNLRVDYVDGYASLGPSEDDIEIDKRALCRMRLL